MIRAQSSILIDKPASEVFDLLPQAETSSLLWGLTPVWDEAVEPGKVYRRTPDAAQNNPYRFVQDWMVSKHQPPVTFAVENAGGARLFVRLKQSVVLSPDGSGTLVSLTQQFAFGPVLWVLYLVPLYWLAAPWLWARGKRRIKRKLEAFGELAAG